MAFVFYGLSLCEKMWVCSTSCTSNNDTAEEPSLQPEGDGMTSDFYMDTQDASTSRMEVDEEDPVNKVFYNDLIMREIVSNVTLMKDRVRIELASRRLKYLSLTSSYKFKKGGEHLRFVFRLHSYHIMIALGDVVIPVPCLTFGIRRDKNIATDREQPSQFLSVLDGIGYRFGVDIKTITLGGRRKIDKDRGIPDHLLVITKDLLEWINECTPSLQSMVIDGVVIDRDALDYFLSDCCTFSERLQSVEINHLTFDSRDAAPRFFTKLFTNSLRSFSLNTFGVSSQGRAFLDVLQSRGQVLDEMTIGIDDGCLGVNPDVDMGKEFLHLASKYTKDLRLRYWYEEYESDCAPLFAMSSDFFQMQNITELDLDIYARTATDVRHLSTVCRNLSHLQLRSFSFGGYKGGPRTDMVLRCLIEGLRGCDFLSRLSISHLPNAVPYQLLGDLLMAVPCSVEELILKSAPFDNDMIVEMLRDRHNIRRLSLSRLSRASASLLFVILKKMNSLEVLECDIICSPPTCNLLSDHTALPNLKSAELLLSQEPKSNLRLSLRSYFKVVFVEPTFVGPRRERAAWYVTVADRKTETPAPPVNNVVEITEEKVLPHRKPRKQYLNWD